MGNTQGTQEHSGMTRATAPVIGQRGEKTRAGAGVVEGRVRH